MAGSIISSTIVVDGQLLHPVKKELNMWQEVIESSLLK